MSNEELNPALRQTDVGSRALLDIPQYSSDGVKFTIGDLVRSYYCGFNNEKPFKNCFKQGVVIATKDKILGDNYIVVKWHTENFFGIIYKFKMALDGSDTFPISVSSPWLVKVNKCQLALSL